jgi:hypothetical protein
MVSPGPALLPRRRRLGCASAALALALLALPASPGAQGDPGQNADWSGDVPAHIAVVDGTASLERDGRIAPAEENVPLLAGDRLRTDKGRVEILFADGSALDIDEYAAVDFLSDALLRLRAGRIRLSITRLADTLNYRVDAAGASALIRAAGEYRLNVPDQRAADPQLDLAVIHGTAELSSPAGRTRVRAGTHAFASERTEPSLPYLFNASASTAFDRWADDQQDTRLGAQSGQYLPADMRYYGGALDQNGTWQYEPAYGNVWFPRVATDWRPYYDGRWSDVGAFGWMWIGVDRWSWPTHHYGRWNVTAGRWFWIPDRHWGPAWVSWAVSPTYVSWCPLGFDGRPAVALATSSRYGDARRAWTIVPARTFTADVVVSRHAVANHTLPPAALSEFVTRRSGPATLGPRTRVDPRRSGATARSLTPPSPDVPERPATPRSPGDPTRPRGGGSGQPAIGVLPVYVVPTRGGPGRPPAPADPNPGAPSPATRGTPPPAPGHIGGGTQSPATPPAPSRGGARGAPPSGPSASAPASPPASRGRGVPPSSSSPPASGPGASVRPGDRGRGGGSPAPQSRR